MSYQAQRYAAVAVAVLSAGLAVILAADPVDFGLSPIAARWLGVVAAMLAVLAGFLPSVRGMGMDPAFLADRISELPSAERRVLATTLADRAEKEAADLPPGWLPKAPRDP